MWKKRTDEELRRKAEEEATKQVLEEFEATFNQTESHSRTWVKGETVHRDQRLSSDKGRLYKPTSRLQDLAHSFKSTQQAGGSAARKESVKKPVYVPGKKKEERKKASNLEAFKEELRMIQEERAARHRQRDEPMRRTRFEMDGSSSGDLPELSPYGPRGAEIALYENDQTTTNLYLGNINPQVTEEELMNLFGKFGPLASVKIMWPRSDAEASRGRHCGFVAYMTRRDADAAFDGLKGVVLKGFEMRLGWGKPVPMPSQPIFVPPHLKDLTQPPPQSGLPFNAQPTINQRHHRDFDKILQASVVKVVIPTERPLLNLIHRMIQFVIREGPMFEAMIMNREMNNPLFRFLFDNQSPAHLYYRWKMFSLLQGDAINSWNTADFVMFCGGSVWRVPPVNAYTQTLSGGESKASYLVSSGLTGPGGSGEDTNEAEDGGKERKPQLSDSQRDRFEDSLRELTPERDRVGDLMVWCLDHAEAAAEVVECLAESLSLAETPLPKKIARLYLISDILHNCGAKGAGAFLYRTHFEKAFPEIFGHIHETYKAIEGRLSAESFKSRVMACFQHWEDTALYPNDFLIRLQNIFLGLVPSTDTSTTAKDSHEEDLDGAPLASVPATDPTADENIDGAPIYSDGSDNGGVTPPPPAVQRPQPAPPAATRAAAPSVAAAKPAFVRSKWEEVDPDDVKAQAVTTSKWDMFDDSAGGAQDEEDIDGKPLDLDEPPASSGGARRVVMRRSPEERKSGGSVDGQSEEYRALLRQIELKVIAYQDDLEAGKIRRSSGQSSIARQVADYRAQLLADAKRNASSSSLADSSTRRDERTPKRKVRRRSRSRSRSRSPASPPRRASRKASRSRSRSPTSSRRRSRSASPARRRRNRSRSKSTSPSRSSRKKSKKSRR